MNGLMWLIVVILAAIAFYTDHRWMMIPNWLTVSAALTGLSVHAITDGWSGVKLSLIGCVGSLLLSSVIYICRGFEAGDVKLFASFGAIGGLEFSFTGLVHSLVIAAAVGIVILFIRKLLHKKHVRGTRIEFPFMYAVLPGLILTYIITEVPL